MAYQAKTFDWKKVLDSITNTLYQITNCDIKYEDSVKNGLKYPYITVSTPQSKNLEAKSLSSRELELFTVNIQINCYAETGNEAIQMADDISTLLRDPVYYEPIKQKGIAIVDVLDNSGGINDFANIFNISMQSLNLKIRLAREYQSSYYQIKEFNKEDN